jgi:starch-binding outer membrane protein, SusD/RagB family
MKKIIYTIAAISVILLSGCEDALDTTNYTKANTANYPQSVSDAEQILAGIYNSLNVATANPQETFFYVATLASDDQLGGGGDNDKLMQAEDLLCNYNENMTEQFWKDRYAGINRANNAIETMGNCTGYDSDNQKNQMLGEAYFLRAFYYYELASMYENIPLITSTSSGTSDVAQSTPAATWAQIIQDCKKAANLMPAKTAESGWVTDGHVDKWCAEALLARAFLFYTGMYLSANPVSTVKPSVTLTDGTTLTTDSVITYIDDCVTNSGYKLVPTFQNLWAYTNEYTVSEYTYTKGKGYSWVENDGAVNPESMFKIKYNEFASWSTTIGYANEYALHFGMRGGQAYANTFPFGQGWGAGPVAPNMWNDWVTYDKDVNGGTTDPRRAASICQISSEVPNYTKGGWSDFVQETDYYEKKLSPITCAKSDGTGYWPTFECRMYSSTEDGTGWGSGVFNNMQLANFHDLVLIRFADVLLMQSELKGDATGMNKVRARVGLPAIAWSQENLENERRWELCFEGTRWNDIRRWHIAGTALDKQLNVSTYHAGVKDTNSAHNGGYSTRYTATNGFFKIPEEQISLSSVLTQNAGWSASSANYTGW